MTDDDKALVERLRRTYRKEFPVTGSMIADNSNRLRPLPILATDLLFNPDGLEAAARIEAQAAEIEKLRDALREVTPPAYFGESEQNKARWAKARAALGETK